MMKIFCENTYYFRKKNLSSMLDLVLKNGLWK